MDYDKLIERLRDFKVKINGEELTPLVCLEATTTIETLWHENQALRGLIKGLDAELSHVRSDLARVTGERDAAIADWRGFCAKCAWNGKQYLADGKMDDRCRTCRENGKCNWKWRGIKEG